MGFHEVRFPVNLSFGSTGGPERRTEVVAISNGFEERNTPWSQSRHRYDAGMGMRSLDNIATLIAFFEARQGRLHGFRWKDWSDYKSCTPSGGPCEVDQFIGYGDGATTSFRLRKTYRSGTSSYARDILKPVEGTVSVAVAGDVKEAGTDFTIDPTTGMVVFASAPALDAEITAGFQFDVPVRFDTDSIITNMASFSAGEMPSVPIVEIRI